MGRADVRLGASSYQQRSVATDKLEGGNENGEAACCMYLQAEALRPYIQSGEYYKYLKVHQSALVGDIGLSIGLLWGMRWRRHAWRAWNGAKSTLVLTLVYPQSRCSVRD